MTAHFLPMMSKTRVGNRLWTSQPGHKNYLSSESHNWSASPHSCSWCGSWVGPAQQRTAKELSIPKMAAKGSAILLGSPSSRRRQRSRSHMIVKQWREERLMAADSKDVGPGISWGPKADRYCWPFRQDVTCVKKWVNFIVCP